MMEEWGRQFSFFFFQAEDGIRDGRVTGVQTCALPILSGLPSSWRSETSGARCPTTGAAGPGVAPGAGGGAAGVSSAFARIATVATATKIGRASCRERVSISVGAGPFEDTREPGHAPRL